MILQAVRTTLLNIEEVHRRRGSTRAAARVSMARALGIGGGTLENLIRDRVKSVSADLAAKIKALGVKTIEAEMARLEHELELARTINLDMDPHDLAATEALLAEARALLRKGGAR